MDLGLQLEQGPGQGQEQPLCLSLTGLRRVPTVLLMTSDTRILPLVAMRVSSVN